MSKSLSRSIGALAFSAVCATSALATTVPLGYVYWGIDIPSSVGKFNIQNNSGVNSDPIDFPITTALSLTSLSLTVHFTGGGTTVFGSSYFTLGLDGISFNGGDIGIGGANPLPTDATLTGSFATTSVNITGLGAQTIAPNFSASILPSTGTTLSDFDRALINVEASDPGGTGGTAPEPSSLLLVGLACALAIKWSTAKPVHRAGRVALN